MISTKTRQKSDPLSPHVSKIEKPTVLYRGGWLCTLGDHPEFFVSNAFWCSFLLTLPTALGDERLSTVKLTHFRSLLLYILKRTNCFQGE